MNTEEGRIDRERWLTTGWGREPNTHKIVELGHVEGVRTVPRAERPEIPIETLEEFFQSLETW